MLINRRLRFKNFLNQINKLKLDGFLLNKVDMYQGEEVREIDERLFWLTGFSGSAGDLLILNNKAALFSDSRYKLQMDHELDSEIYDCFDYLETSMEDWIINLQLNKQKKYKIGFYKWTVTQIKFKNLSEKFSKFNILFEGVEYNPIDKIWKNRPQKKVSKFWKLEKKYYGLSSNEKIKKAVENIKKNNSDLQFISSPTNVNWILNIRGNDLKCTPLHLCFAFLDTKENITIVYDYKNNKNNFKNNILIENLDSWLKKCSGKKILCDPLTIPTGVVEKLKKNKLNILYKSDDLTNCKSKKNRHEIEGFNEAHLYDGIALTKFWYWFENNFKSNVFNESYISKKLNEFRKEEKKYICDSFETIVGFGSNAAIVHYRPIAGRDSAVKNNNILLIDSGAHYECGTTDITRTFAIGKPNREVVFNSTIILSAHINLSKLIFPKNSTGMQLDAICRNQMWLNNLDYGHGTGHGVGHILSVHESPPSLSKMSNNYVVRGNIISNEPGYYKTNNYGIRHENLLEVINDKKNWLKFKCLTIFPFDLKLVDKSFLNSQQICWLNEYHKEVYNILSNYLSDDLKLFLKKKCISI